MESGVYQSGWHEWATKALLPHERTYQNQQLGKAAPRRNSAGKENRKSPADVPTKVDLRVRWVTLPRRVISGPARGTKIAFSLAPWQNVLPARHSTPRRILTNIPVRAHEREFPTPAGPHFPQAGRVRAATTSHQR